MKPNHWCTWGYHASKAWYLSHATNHYQCTWILMANTYGKRITNMFWFKHHAIPVLEITATNKTIDATERLTPAIAGIQDAPPGKVEAIQSLRTLLLGEVAPLPPPAPSILPTPLVLTPLVNIDKPVIIWNPQEVQPSPPSVKHNTHDISPNHNTPAIVENNSGDNTPTPIQSTHPPCHHLICPLQNCPLTRNQLQLHTTHMINCIIADELMPTSSLCTHPPSLHHVYAFAAQSNLLETISPPSHSIIHFIGANIDNDTGNVLKYQHLMNQARLGTRFCQQTRETFPGYQKCPWH
jgi:hypothetical protein